MLPKYHFVLTIDVKMSCLRFWKIIETKRILLVFCQMFATREAAAFQHTTMSMSPRVLLTTNHQTHSLLAGTVLLLPLHRTNKEQEHPFKACQSYFPLWDVLTCIVCLIGCCCHLTSLYKVDEFKLFLYLYSNDSSSREGEKQKAYWHNCKYYIQ